MKDVLKIIGYVLAVAAVIGVLVLMILASVERQDWLDKHCTVIGKMSGSVAPGITTNGSFAATYIPGKTGYQCDDGKTYWE